MVDVKISELPVGSSANSTDQLEANQAGTTRSITVAQVVSGYLTTATAASTYQPIDADLTALAGLNATAGLVEQTGAAAFTKRLMGVTNATDIPTRANADARYLGATAAAGGDLAGSYPNPTIKPSVTNGQVLTTTGGVAGWATPAANKLLQTVFVETGAVATGSTLIPQDDTIPQITEGNEYMTLAITPQSATSKLIIDVMWCGGSSVTNNLVVGLFQDATANALACVPFLVGASALVSLSLRHVMTSGTTSATTFRVRVGGNAAGTTTFNGISTRFYGGVLASSIVIREILP